MRESSVKGKNGETLIANYLKKQGYIVVERNFHSRFGEIDIIAENEQYILFVEVKMRKQDSLVNPAEAVDAVKQQKIMMTAEIYLSRAFCELQPRFDVAEVTVFETKGREEYKINYIENAF